MRNYQVSLLILLLVVPCATAFGQAPQPGPALPIILSKITAVTVIYAIFWAAAISAMRTYKIFHIWLGTWGQALMRLIVGVVVLNIVPLVLAWFVLQVVPDQSRATGLCAGIASLSVFSICFLLPGVLQTGLGDRLYPTVATLPMNPYHAAILPTDTVWHAEAVSDGLAPGEWIRPITMFFAYLIVPLFAAWLLGWVLG